MLQAMFLTTCSFVTGHVRYSTSASKDGAQSMLGESNKYDDFAIANNCNLIFFQYASH
jgi:glutamine phosphoribosylpyrophosphate amidotransferase